MKRWIVAGLAGLMVAGGAAAQQYPAKAVRLLVGYAPGGGTDIMARVISQKLSEAFGQQFVVDNRPGANANLAAELASRAQPDGYTLLMISVSHAIATLGADPVGGSSGQFGAYIKSEVAK